MSTKDDNPFSMPTDEEIFALRDIERQKKLAVSVLILSVHVADFTTRRRDNSKNI